MGCRSTRARARSTRGELGVQDWFFLLWTEAIIVLTFEFKTQNTIVSDSRSSSDHREDKHKHSYAKERHTLVCYFVFVIMKLVVIFF